MLLGNLAQAIADTNWPAVRALNHELAGTSGNLGVRLIHALTNGMGQACRDEDATLAAGIHAEMQHALDGVRAFVRDRG